MGNSFLGSALANPTPASSPASRRHPTPSHPHQDSVCSISSVCRGLGEGSLPARIHSRLTIAHVGSVNWTSVCVRSCAYVSFVDIPLRSFRESFTVT